MPTAGLPSCALTKQARLPAPHTLLERADGSTFHLCPLGCMAAEGAPAPAAPPAGATAGFCCGAAAATAAARPSSSAMQAAGGGTGAHRGEASWGGGAVQGPVPLGARAGGQRVAAKAAAAAALRQRPLVQHAALSAGSTHTRQHPHTCKWLPKVPGFVGKDVAPAQRCLAHIAGQLAAHHWQVQGREG